MSGSITKLKKRKQYTQHSPEWIAAHVSGIDGVPLVSASSAIDALSLGSASGRAAFVDQKIKQTYRPLYCAAVEWGTRYETVARKLYEYKYNKHVNEFGLILHDVYPYIGASTDGVTDDLINLELKVPTSREFGELPIQYWIQTQIQMFVLDLYMTDYFELKLSESVVIVTDESIDDTDASTNFGYMVEFYNGGLKYVYSEVNSPIEWLRFAVRDIAFPIIRTVKWTESQSNLIRIPRDDLFIEACLPKLGKTVREIVAAQSESIARMSEGFD
jgi:hypothetical protein